MFLALPRLCGIVALLSGCSRAPVDAVEQARLDRAFYRSALGRSGDLDAAARTCAGIADADLRGDCIAAVMDRSGPRDPRWCDEVAPPGAWREECWFVAADDPDAAYAERVARCARAGRFQADCLRHQRLREADVLGGGAGEPTARLAALDRLVEGLDGPATLEVDVAFWRAVYIADGAVDTTACAPQPERCLAASRALVHDKTRRALNSNTPLCAVDDAPAAVELAPGVTLGPDPQVAAWVREALPARCPDRSAIPAPE